MNCSYALWCNYVQGTVRLFIEVEDYDSFNADDHVDDVYVTITRTPSSSFSSRQAYNGIHGNSRIELSFRVQCTANFYGSDCATRCVPRDDSQGHYRCGSNGQRICLSGWSGPSTSCTTRKLSNCVAMHSYNIESINNSCVFQWMSSSWRILQQSWTVFVCDQ